MTHSQKYEDAKKELLYAFYLQMLCIFSPFLFPNIPILVVIILAIFVTNHLYDKFEEFGNAMKD